MERGEEEKGRAGMRGKVNGRERKIWKWQKRQRTSGMRHKKGRNEEVKRRPETRKDWKIQIGVGNGKRKID